MESNRDDEKGEVIEFVTVTINLSMDANKERRIRLGEIVVTPNAWTSVSVEDITDAIGRHRRGDWGDVSKEDKMLNEMALREGTRLLSAYRDRAGTGFWIITEADRSVTTILLPEDY